MTTRLNMTAEQRDFLTLVIEGAERWRRSYAAALDLYMRAYTLGIASMLDEQVQHYAYQHLMKLNADDLIFDVWGIDPENRAQAFPYYQAAA